MPERPRRWGVGSNQYKKEKRPGASISSRGEDQQVEHGGADSEKVSVQTTSYDQEMVAAREATLDALEVLRDHRDALVVIGAQAVYEHTRHLADAPPTTTNDGDLLVDPTLVSDRPLMSDAMASAGFHPARPERPGIYSRKPGTPGGNPVSPRVDLIAPEALAGTGRRGARMGVHGRSSVGRARGVEMALLDTQMCRFGPVGSSDRQPVEVAVAGVAALVCAKSWKLHERFSAADAGKPSRLRPKDAADMWRLMAVSSGSDVRDVFAHCEQHPRFGVVSHEGRRALTEMFSEGGRGCDLVVIGLASSGLSEQRLYDTMSQWMTQFVESP